jgi:hypothetical protein
LKQDRFKKEDSVYFIAFVLLAIGLYLKEPQSGSGAARIAGAVGEAIILGAILAVIPWGIVKIVVRIMRKPSYPAQ